MAASAPSLAERLLDLWTFRRRWLAAAALVPFFVLFALMARDRAIAGRRAEASAALERAVRAWVEDDLETSAREARRAAELAPGRGWPDLVQALAERREPGAFDDPSVQAAAGGVSRRLAGHPDEALDDLQRAAYLAPGALVPKVLLAVTALDARDVELATRELTAAVELLPDSPALLEKLAWAHYNARNLDEAEHLYRRALELEPDDPRLWERLARVYFRRPDVPRGLEAIGRAYDLSQGEASHEVLTLYAFLLDMAREPVRAREILYEMARRFPDRGTPWSRIGRTYDWEHDLAKAEEMYLRGVDAGDVAASCMYLAHLYAGGDRDTCEECRRAYAEHPSFLDPDRAEQCALRALDAGGASVEMLPEGVADVARAIGRRERIGERLRELKDASDSDAVILRLERALRELRKP